MFQYFFTADIGKIEESFYEVNSLSAQRKEKKAKLLKWYAITCFTNGKVFHWIEIMSALAVNFVDFMFTTLIT